MFAASCRELQASGLCSPEEGECRDGTIALRSWSISEPNCRASRYRVWGCISVRLSAWGIYV